MIRLVMCGLLAPAWLTAGSFWESSREPLTQLVSLALALFGVPLLIKLSRKLGLTINEQQASDAIDALINIIVNIDLGKGGTGAEKKAVAVEIAKNSLSVAQQKVLVKKYGTLEAAVQVAFERSSLNNKGAK